MRAVWLAAVAAAGVMLSAGAAGAEIITVTWSGTVTDGIDNLGRFGAVGGDLAGANFAAVYTFDTTKGSGLFADHGGTSLVGGTTQGFQDSVGEAVLTINGSSAVIKGDALSFIESFDIGTPLEFDTDVAANLGSTGPGSLFLRGIGSSPDLPLDFTVSSGPINPCVDTGCSGTFSVGIGQPGSVTKGDLSPTSLTVAVGAAVPEPSSWALLIVGFGVLGATLRLRRLGAVTAVPLGS